MKNQIQTEKNQNELVAQLTSGLEVIELEERLEMVHADALTAAASCCMDSTDK